VRCIELTNDLPNQDHGLGRPGFRSNPCLSFCNGGSVRCLPRYLLCCRFGLCPLCGIPVSCGLRLGRIPLDL
jgi:hypothetical protein